MKQSPGSLVFYVSGHGFGHASRDIEVINAVRRQAPDLRIVVRSRVARWFFDLSLQASVERAAADTDSGMVQVDGLTLDEDESARRAEMFYGTFSSRVRAEAAALRNLRASVVVGDIPPLAFAAADASGVPSIAIGNFTWDWIYQAYPQFESLAPAVVPLIRDAYAKAVLALRLPFGGGFGPMRAVTRDLPLVARQSSRPADETRRRLGLDARTRLVLPSFGGHETNLPYAEIARKMECCVVVTDHEMREPSDSGGRLRRFSGSELRARGVAYEDLVAAADVVVSKPGYGIVSECIANHTPLLYTSRGRFIEHDVMVAEMPRFLRCRFLSQDDLRSGRWEDAADALLLQPEPPERMATNGAEVAARAILALLGA